MKRFLIMMGLTTAIFLMLFVSMRQSVAAHTTQAQTYLSLKLYDEAMQEYVQAAMHIRLMKSVFRLFGEFNAILACLGIFLIISGLMIGNFRSPSRIFRIKFNR